MFDWSSFSRLQLLSVCFCFDMTLLTCQEDTREIGNIWFLWPCCCMCAQCMRICCGYLMITVACVYGVTYCVVHVYSLAAAEKRLRALWGRASLRLHGRAICTWFGGKPENQRLYSGGCIACTTMYHYAAVSADADVARRCLHRVCANDINSNTQQTEHRT